MPLFASSAPSSIIKTKRVTTGSIATGVTALVTVTWDTAFSDSNYTATAEVIDSTTTSLALAVVHIESQSSSAITVRISNTSLGSLTGTIHCIGVHD